ncbi:MAG: hypothetical protein U0800_15870 [Isosphaeraceae bacterium]
MHPGELELYPTRDLVEELLRRSTFQGVIVHAIEESREPDWQGERLFTMRHSQCLGTDEAARLLDIVSSFIAQRE